MSFFETVATALLTGDGREFCDSYVDDLLISRSHTEALVDDDLLQDGHLHARLITELLDEGGNDAFLYSFLRLAVLLIT